MIDIEPILRKSPFHKALQTKFHENQTDGLVAGTWPDTKLVGRTEEQTDGSGLHTRSLFLLC
jgi:hypothetical protein